MYSVHSNIYIETLKNPSNTIHIVYTNPYSIVVVDLPIVEIHTLYYNKALCEASPYNRYCDYISSPIRTMAAHVVSWFIVNYSGET